jgi:hypothetical protein
VRTGPCPASLFLYGKKDRRDRSSLSDNPGPTRSAGLSKTQKFSDLPHRLSRRPPTDRDQAPGDAPRAARRRAAGRPCSALADGSLGIVPLGIGLDAAHRRVARARREGDRGIEIDHRSCLSCANSCSSSCRGATGARGGGSALGKAGGVIQPRRTASARNASASTRLLPALGGTRARRAGPCRHAARPSPVASFPLER